MPQEVRYGIIGSGMMGNEHIAHIKLMDDARVVAIADPDEECCTVAANAAGGEVAIYTDYTELLANDDVDAVIISSPNYTHRAVLEHVFETGKHILCEKPLCTTVEDCRYVRERAEQHPGLFWVAMEYRYIPAVTRFVDEIHAGRIGRLVMLSIREHRFPFLPKIGDWNRFARYTGGTLVEKCCHFFDLMNLIIQAQPVRVFASGGQDVNHLDEEYDGEVPDILDNAYVIVDYDNGARALLDLCMFAECSKNEQEMAATGDGGKMECFIPESVLRIGKRWVRGSEEVSIPVEEKLLHIGHYGSTYVEHQQFLHAIRSGGPARVTAAEGMLAVCVGVAAEHSVVTGLPCELRDGIPVL